MHFVGVEAAAGLDVRVEADFGLSLLAKSENPRVAHQATNDDGGMTAIAEDRK